MKCSEKRSQKCERSARYALLLDQRANNKATESGIGIRVSIWVAVGFLAVVCVFLLPLGTEFGGIHDDRGLFDRLCERRNSLLARGRKRTFIRMFDYISMRATVAGAHDNLIGGTEFARHGVEGMRESCSSHRVRQSSTRVFFKTIILGNKNTLHYVRYKNN